MSLRLSSLDIPIIFIILLGIVLWHHDFRQSDTHNSSARQNDTQHNGIHLSHTQQNDTKCSDIHGISTQQNATQ